MRQALAELQCATGRISVGIEGGWTGLDRMLLTNSSYHGTLKDIRAAERDFSFDAPTIEPCAAGSAYSTRASF
jgi:hypothetical protein